ncbi:MAG: TolC family protein [Myxococcales bacterium]|nr:TolC family protein [Myxococcales bacterium]
MLNAILCLVALLAPPAVTDFAPADRGGGPEAPLAGTLDDLLAAASQGHPGLAAEHARWRAAQADAQALDRWADPAVSYTGAPLPIETRLGPNHHTLGVTQRLPWPGQTDAAVATAQAQGRQAAQRFQAAYLDLRAAAAAPYWQLWALDREEALRGAQAQVLEALAQGLKGRVEAGQRPASALARVGLAQSRLADRVAALTPPRRTALALLAQALGRGVPPQPVLPAEAPDVTAPPPLEAALAQTPDPPRLQALAAQVAMQEAMVRQAELAARPGFEVGAVWQLIDEGDSTMPEKGRDALLFRVGLTLPVWGDANAARVSGARARVQGAQAELTGARQGWRAALQATHAGWAERHRRQGLLRDTLLPQAQTVLQMLRGDYAVDRAELTAVLDALTQVHDLQVELARTQAEGATLQAQWQALVAEEVAP